MHFFGPRPLLFILTDPLWWPLDWRRRRRDGGCGTSNNPHLWFLVLALLSSVRWHGEWWHDDVSLIQKHVDPSTAVGLQGSLYRPVGHHQGEPTWRGHLHVSGKISVRMSEDSGLWSALYVCFASLRFAGVYFVYRWNHVSHKRNPSTNEVVTLRCRIAADIPREG